LFIYVIVCDESLKLYVGQHKGRDLRQYLRSKWYAAHHRLSDRSRLYAALRKYPRESWSIHPLVSGVETRPELDELEKYFIRVLKTQHSDVGYNICRGGEGFTGPHTEKSRQKMSRIQRKSYTEHPERGRFVGERFAKMWADPAFRRRMREIHKNTPNVGRFRKGQKPSPLSGAKEANKTSFSVGHLPWNTGTRGIKKPNSGSFQKGHHMNRGRMVTEAQRQKLRMSHLGQIPWNKGKRLIATSYTIGETTHV
jgi:group I intron endonuclease